MTQEKQEKLMAIANYIYWFKDFVEDDNRKDFITCIRRLMEEIKREDE